MRLTGAELRLNPPALADGVRLAARIVGRRKLAQHVVEQRAHRVDQEVLHGAWLGTPLSLRFGLAIDRAALPDVPLDDVDIDDVVGNVAELIESLSLEEVSSFVQLPQMILRDQVGRQGPMVR